MNTKQVIIPVENDSRIDVSRITPETQGIILVKSAQDECIGYISYNSEGEQWGFYNEGDTAITAEIGDTLLECTTSVMKNYDADHFDFIEFV